MKNRKEKLIDIQAESCHRYLSKIKEILESDTDLLLEAGDSKSHKSPYMKFKNVAQKVLCLEKYSNSKKIKKLYRDFHDCVRKIAEHELSEPDKDNSQRYDKLFIGIYENNNQSDQVLQENTIGEDVGINRKTIKDAVELKTKNPSKVNLSHPDNPFNAFGSSMLGFKYDPLRKNNIPYVAFDQDDLPYNRKCIHIGAQTRKNGIVNPTFKRYLLANSRSNEVYGAPGDVDYVYFNLMKRTQDAQTSPKKGRVDKFVRGSEGRRSRALESLNNDPKFKSAVVTLPADGYFFLGSFSMKAGGSRHKKGSFQSETLTSLEESLKESIMNDQNDFCIPDNIKNMLFGEDFDNGRFELLFQEAASDILGQAHLEGERTITPEERNAVLFHFIKFHLTNFILDELNPRVYNMSCKDAIDRGAIHSLWYHLNLKHQMGQPMSQSEFLKHLYAPALLVKYRSINHNQNLIWNVLKNRIENDISFQNNHPWAVEWLQKNTPPSLLENERASNVDESSASLTSNGGLESYQHSPIPKGLGDEPKQPQIRYPSKNLGDEPKQPQIRYPSKNLGDEPKQPQIRYPSKNLGDEPKQPQIRYPSKKR